MRIVEIITSDSSGVRYGVGDDFVLPTDWMYDPWLVFEKADGAQVAVRTGAITVVNVYDES